MYYIDFEKKEGDFMMKVKNKGSKLTALALGTVLIFQTMFIGTIFADAENKIKVACVGDSITEGLQCETNDRYPEQLQTLLGEGYEVGNFGLSGANVIKAGASYIGCGDYNESIAMTPDIVVIMLGTNDIMANPFDFSNSKIVTEFKEDYTRLINKYKAINDNVKLILMSSPACKTSRGESYVKSDYAIGTYIRNLTKELAAENGCVYVDIYGYTKENFDLNGNIDYYDDVHFNATGCRKLAAKVYEAIEGIEKPSILASTLSKTTISIIPNKDITGDLYIAAYKSQGQLIGVDKIANVSLAEGVSTAINVDNASISDADFVRVYCWKDEVTPQTDSVETGDRFTPAGSAVLVKGTLLNGSYKNHGIIIKDSSGKTVYVNQMKTNQSGEYQYIFTPQDNGKYTVYSTGTKGGIVENFDYQGAAE